MEEIKVTELPEASQINDADWLMIVQSGTNKKVTKSNSKFLDVKNTHDTSTTEPYSCSYVNSKVVEVKNAQDSSTTTTYSCDYENKYFGGVVLYNNASGSNSDITLSESANNYNYLEIFFRTNDGETYRGSVKIQVTNNAVTSLLYSHYEPNTLYAKYKEVRVSGTSISNVQYVEYYFSNGSNVTVTVNNNIYITRVIGYK